MRIPGTFYMSIHRHIFDIVIKIGILLSIITSTIHAREPIIIPRISEPITLDGHIDEPVWITIDSLPLTMHVPTFGLEPQHPTDIRVAYDDTYIYLAAICHTPPEEIFATSYRRDLMAPTTDYIGIVLDTFNDNENALAFSVMPTSARLDYTVSNDAQGSSPMNTSWNTFWDAETARFEGGWSVEIRIPLSSLRFQDTNGKVEMGMIVFRWFASNTSVATYPPIPPNWGFWSFSKPSQAQKVILENVYSRKPVYITPYALGGMEQAFRLNSARTLYIRNDDPSYNLGLDLKYGLTNNLTLDLTFNTDFAQVEADDQQVNLTRFSLFFPEKRLFFQERASIFNFGAVEYSNLFDFSQGTTNQLFYSRRIGLYEGTPVAILGGLRLVGRLGGWDIGALNMQTAREKNILVEESSLPSENFGVLRLRRQVFNPYSYAGIMLTTRIQSDGRYNTAYGFDGVIRMFSEDYLSVSWAQSAGNDVPFDATDFNSTRVHTRWERRLLDGFGYDISYSRSGEMYNPELGFILRRDYTRIGDRIFYGWFPGERSSLQRHQIYLNGAVYLRNADNSIESFEYGPSWEATLKSGNSILLKAFMFRENLDEAFVLSDHAEVPPGTYNFVNAAASYEIFGGRTRGSVAATGGTFYDGTSVSFSVNPSLILSRHVQMQGFYRYTRIRFPKRKQEYDGHLVRLKVDASMNTKLSTAAFIQYNYSIHAVIINMRIRYNPREGNDLYIVYNEGLNTNRDRGELMLPPTSNRTILIKYTYTFVY
jgi:hypothetical protein